MHRLAQMAGAGLRGEEAIQLLEAGLAGNAPIQAPLPPAIKLRGGHIATIEEIEAYIADGQK